MQLINSGVGPGLKGKATLCCAVPALRRLKEDDCKLKASLSLIARPGLKQTDARAT